MSGIDLRDLEWILRGDFTVGSWFVFEHAPVPKERSWILVESPAGKATVDAHPRSTSTGSGLVHARHPWSCSPRCRIKDPGWISWQARNVPVGRLMQSYTCLEPDARVLPKLLAGRQP